MMDDELRKKLAAEFMQRTADGRLAQAAKRLLAPVGIHHDWRLPAGWDSFLKAVEEVCRMAPERRIEIKHLLSDGGFVIGHVHVVQRPGDPGSVGFFLLRFEGEHIAEMWAARGQGLQADSPNVHGAF
jgi:predicted SnoaL-like aldol condensation-catalyzing enzyme